MNVKDTQRYVRNVCATFESFCKLLDQKSPNPIHVSIAKRRVRDYLWNLRRTSGVGNDDPYLSGDQIIKIQIKSMKEVDDE